MVFADKEAEDCYMKLMEKYGYVHINTGSKPITAEDIKSTEKVIEEIISKKVEGR